MVVGSSARSVTQNGVDRIVAAVRDALMLGEISPGQRLVEADLCLRYGVGRSQVREALNRLASENLVELSRNRGATIKRMTVAEIVGAIEVMEVLVGLAARRAASSVNDGADRVALNNALAALHQAAAGSDTHQLLAARREVYLALIVSARNAELGRIVDSMQYHVLQGQIPWSSLHRELNSELEAVVAAVLSGDASSAERLARAHIRRMLPG